MHKIAFSFLAAALALAVAAPPALAQGTTGFPMGDVAQSLGRMSKPMIELRAPPSPLTRLRRKARDWIEAETARQVEAPRSPITVALEIEETLGEDILRLAKRERIRPDDISNAVLLKIMMDAEDAVQRRGDADALAVAHAHLREALDWQSQISLALAAM